MTRIVSRQRDIGVPGLAPELAGLRITHLSDLHIGSLTPPHRLPEVIDACHRLEGDLIAVTGDVIDLSLNVLEQVLDGLRRLAAPLGVYFVPGNHDYLEDGDRFKDMMRAAGLNLLVDQNVEVATRGRRLLLCGVDHGRHRDLGPRVCDLLATGKPGADLRVVLAHHPDAFDAAARMAAHLTLSGHTHGGQLAFSDRRGRKGSIGLGSLAFRYPRGLYRQGDCHLHVTTGVGAWFPLRVRCPAEIACLRLVPGVPAATRSAA